MRVHFAEHMYSLLDTIELEIQRIVQTSPQEPNYTVTDLPSGLIRAQQNGEDRDQACDGAASSHVEPRSRRLPFRNMTLAQAGKALLREHGQLHGKEIERRVKDGGYKTKARHFQQSLLSAFERDGGFENIGGNIWQLKAESPKPSLNLNGNQPNGEEKQNPTQ
jgi:hypothetical protein